jgi:ElaA protein
MLNWDVISWKDLSRDALYEILALRAEVFVVEQDCPYQDVDGKDAKSLHVVAWSSADYANSTRRALAYTRIVFPGVSYVEPSIGRVVTAAEVRGQGVGVELMRQSITACQRHFPGQPIRISAQSYLEKFYVELGFVATGKTYLEDGIPHLEMLLAGAG